MLTTKKSAARKLMAKAVGGCHDQHGGDIREMVISILHELEHIRGVTSEKEAERRAPALFWSKV